ncbi:hypothetical protein ACFL5X_02460 [Candidatus Omnitrophota bacterium]
MILFIVFCLVSITYPLSLYPEDAVSANFELAFVKVGSDVAVLSSSDSLFTYFVINDNFSVPVKITAASEEISFSYDDFLPRLVSDIDYEIAEVGSKTHIGGFEIPQEIWQKDNDPYFYWLIFINPPTVIKGYSLAVDEFPDEVVETSSTFYQYPDNSFADGKHTFYVMPSISTEVWGAPVSFEIWVDTNPPGIDSLVPAPGAMIIDPEVRVSCRVMDDASGLDLDTLVLQINEQAVSFDYDEASYILSYIHSISEGETTVLVEAEDMTGNKTVRSWSFITDVTPPVGSLLINNDDAVTNSAYVVLKLDVEEDLTGIKYIYISNDGIFDSEMSSPRVFAPVIEDWLLDHPDISETKTVYVKLEDNAGNRSPAYSDQIDLVVTVPDTRIVSAPPSLTQETGADFYFEASRPSCLFSYSLDGSDWSGWTPDTSAGFTGVSLGSHLFSVKAGFDSDGNGEISLDEEDPTPAQWAWTVREETLIERIQRTLFFRRQ